MKAILISINPKWVAKILNGEKTLEIRKTVPKCDLPIDVYIYCTKDRKQCLVRNNVNKTYHLDTCYWEEFESNLNGKVVAKFTLNKVETIKLPYTYFGTNKWVSGEHERTLQTETLDEKDLLKASCINEEEIYKYLNFKHSPNCCGYAWHIDNLVIFDKPKELSDFFVYSHTIDGVNEKNKPQKYNVLKRLNKAPQSYCYIKDVL